MITRGTRLAAAAAVLIACSGLAACESSQSRSAKLKAQAGTATQAQAGSVVAAPSTTLSATGTTVLTDENGTAVVVELASSKKATVDGVPIQVSLADDQGNELFTNTTPGLQFSLTHGQVEGGAEPSYWVNDQIPVTLPTTATVSVGDPDGSVQSTPIKFTASIPKLQEDPASGLSGVGTVTHDAGERQERVLVTVIARKGNTIVAAGRSIVAKAKANGKTPYTAFFIGDPTGATLTATARLSHDSE